MLTIEKAKNADCPHFYDSKANKYRKCQAGDCPKWKDSDNKEQWCIHIVYLQKEKCFAYEPSFGSECPIREHIDALIKEPHKAKRARPEMYSRCNGCPKRYGRCAG